MDIPIEICLRGDDFASKDSISGIPREPAAWTDADIRRVLEGMLQAMHRRRHPDTASDRTIALRGLSWIVSPFESGGVVIAIEITMGVAVAGPFNIEQGRLEAMVARVLTGRSESAAPRVH